MEGEFIVEAKIIQFAVRDNNNFFKLEIAKALLHLIEFDFTYFWEKCIEAGRIAKKTGRLPQPEVVSAKAAISGIHPYVEGLIGDDFSEIVTDCIIEYICHSERIGLEELWVRCISPKNLYEEAIFKRISEYKTGKAINQWGNIIKIQEYARNKVSFIYDCDEEIVPQPREILKVRKEYFDLAYSVAANELGISGDKLPTVRFCSPELMPNATFMNAKVSKAIYRRFAEALRLGGDLSVPESKNCTKIYDGLAMEAYTYVRGMKRPAEIDMKFALEALKNNEDIIYMPDSFKAVVDLEFDLMMQNDIVLRKCDSCGRYFIAYDDGFCCDRINSSGKTCRDRLDEMRRKIANAVNAEQTHHAEQHTEEKPSQPVPSSGTVPPELEERGQKIYNDLSKHVGSGIDENEFREWSTYLSDMKRNITKYEASTEQLEEFLDYSDKLYNEVKHSGEARTPVKTPIVQEKAFEPGVVMADSDPEMSHIHVPIKDDDPVFRTTGIRGVSRVVSSDEVEIKPFRPEAFDSLMDAFMADHISAEAVPGDASPEAKDKAPVEVKAFQWKRMTRAEAYGLVEGEDK